jgi:hypothetical protein
MTDDFTFDWVALAPIEEIATLVERICVARGLDGLWYSSTPSGIPVKGCRINGADGATLAVLTLQGYYPDQTHLRLQSAAHTAEPTAVMALADALYAALREAGRIPGAGPLFASTPRFIRPQGFRPRPGEAE